MQKITMKAMTKMSAIILALSLSLTACLGTGSTPTPAASSTESPTAAPAVTSAAAPAEPAAMYPVAGNPKLTFLRTADAAVTQVGLTSYQQAPGFIAWQEQTGINVKIIEPADITAVLLLLSSGDIPDMILMGKNSYSGGIPKMVEDGLAINLTDKLADWAPDYYKFLNSSDFYMNAVRETDGNIYAFGGYAFQLDSPFRSYNGLIARKEYLDKLSLPVPKTTDEFYTFLYRMKHELGVAIPLCSGSGNVIDMLKHGTITSAFGLVSSVDFYKDGQYHYGSYDPEYKDVLAYLHKLYAEELMDVNFAVTDGNTAQSTLVKGDSGAIMAAVSRIQVMDAAAKSDDFNLVALPSLVKNNGDRALSGHSENYVSSGNYWSYITTQCKNVEAAMKFLNYTFSEQGHILYNFGVEGVSFNYVNMEPTYTDLITNNKDGYALDPMLRAHALLNFAGVQDIKMSMQRFPMQEQIDACATWADNDGDKYKIVNDNVAPELRDEYTKLWADIQTYIDEMRAKFISGAEPLSNFDKYISKLKGMGMDRVIEIRQKSYELYNK